MKKFFTIFVLLCVCFAYTTATASAQGLTKLEHKNDATVGVYGINTATGQTYSHNADTRFAYASTFKAITSGLLLQQNSPEALNKTVTIKESDIVAYSPVTEQYVGKTMTLRQLISAAMLQSDNTASNIIMEQLGGLDQLSSRLQALGDTTTNPQRYEPELNNYDPQSTADTSTPRATAHNLQNLLTTDAVAPQQRKFLQNLMLNNKTGESLIKKSVPNSYKVGDKSGQGTTYGTRNDVAVIYPKHQTKPIILVVFTKHQQQDAQPQDELVAQAARHAIHQLD